MAGAVSGFSADPLFSCVITLYALILLYFPRALGVAVSPVLVLTAVLLLSLLRLSAVQRLQNPKPERKESEDGNLETPESCRLSSLTDVDTWVQRSLDLDEVAKPDFEGSFVVWDVGAPLEVIYEEYEGGEEGEGHNPDPDPYPIRFPGLDRYPSLSIYYPETDSDSSSYGGLSVTGEWESPESVCFTWEEEDQEGLLIEIALDGRENKDSEFNVEEDNLIEIDISSSPFKDD